MKKQENKFNDLFEIEFSFKEAQQAILFFLLFSNIRGGEYEGNEYVIRKLSDCTFVAYKEYIYPDTHIERDGFILFTINELWIELKEYLNKDSEELFEMANLGHLLGTAAQDYFTDL